MAPRKYVLQPSEVLKVKVFEDVSINPRGYVLFSLTSFDPGESPKVMVHDMISVMRDAMGFSPKWYKGDVYLYLQGSDLMMKKMGYIDEREIAKNVVDFDVCRGNIAVLHQERKKPSRDFITDKVGIMDEYNIGPLYKDSIPRKVLRTKKFQDEGWITGLSISESGKVAYAKVLDISPIRQALFIDGDKVFEITGFIGEIKWAGDKIVIRNTNLEEKGFFGKKELLILEENGDYVKIDIPGDPGDWVEVYPAPGGSALAYHEGKLYFISTESGKSVVRELDMSSLEHKVLISGDRSVHGVDASSYGLAFIWSSITRSSVLSIYRWKDSKEIEVASATRVPDVGVSVVNERHVVLGKSEKKVIMLHGGPRTCYGISFNFEALMYALNGYEVHMVNYPGSAGFEECENVEGIVKDIAEYIRSVQGKKVLYGESFGAFLALMVSSLVNDLSGLIVERGIYEALSGHMASDEGFEFEKLTYKLSDPIDHPEDYIKYSPIFLIKGIKFPVLVIGATDDWRCPFAQSVALYNMLKRYGKEAYLLVLSGTHNVKYSGESREKVYRLSKIMEWVEKCFESD
ncbi:MAG: hypothetical protein DRN30_04760 [Thermoplasmata archaeon]|nr:MAG: hypothetical protein DRN30_04760 [Thermoplasmata archaeon]